MKALRTLTILFALALMCLPAPSAAAAEKPFKLDICAMPEHESFIFWYAKEQGWDKDEGLDFQIHFFQTGMDQLEALPAKQWVVGGTGTVPILVGALRYNIPTSSASPTTNRGSTPSRCGPTIPPSR